MSYRFSRSFVPVNIGLHTYIKPPLCRNYQIHGVPVKTQFTGHQHNLRYFVCPVCGKRFTMSV